MTRGEATRARIEREALRLFARKGVDATSVKEIAAAVGVADAALYRHFASKDEIGRQVFLRHYGELARAVAAIGARPAPFAAKVGALVAMFCTLFDEQPDVFAFILVHQHAHLRFVSEDASENAVAALALIMAKAYSDGDIGEPDPELAAGMALGAVVQPAVFKIYGRLPGPLAGRAEALTRAALAAAGALECSSKSIPRSGRSASSHPTR